MFVGVWPRGVMIYQYTLKEKPLFPQFPLEFMRNTKIWKKTGYTGLTLASKDRILDLKSPCIPYS